MPRSCLFFQGSIRIPHGCYSSNSIFLRVIFKAREAITPIYRAYLIDRDNRIASYKPIDVNTNPEALKAAYHYVDGCDVEVWYRSQNPAAPKRPNE
jgi:hypothetical protein